ncbi:hypothetical protein DSO57_1033584 [Entomophthora muscae]|uniref:Uncharacterized protein n=1 Tax=Entomophthora muscae TaxID=34485 RepID=A0ACC2T0A4_9FUNG|nr:hypothetical protein DSO57_1033584 [Entomophthora muscae]
MDANSSPSKDTICSAIHVMDSGVAGNGAFSEHLAIQQPSAENTLVLFQNLSQVNPDQLCQDLCTVNHIKDYLQKFTHPSVCHSQINLVCNQSTVFLALWTSWRLKSGVLACKSMVVGLNMD